jgi:hypothetical protein
MFVPRLIASAVASLDEGMGCTAYHGPAAPTGPLAWSPKAICWVAEVARLESHCECESIPHLSRIGRSAKTNFPLTDSAFSGAQRIWLTDINDGRSTEIFSVVR